MNNKAARITTLGFAVFFLSACSANENAPDPAIFLRCEGESIDFQTGIRTPRDGTGYTYRIYPGNQFQTGLHAFIVKDELWSTPCVEMGFQCILHQSPDEFTEIAELAITDGTVVSRMTKRINRRTGEYTETQDGGFPFVSKVVYEGSCVSTEPPAQSAAKF